jgi:hypothetical protein
MASHMERTMETFDTLDALYSHLEEKAGQYNYPTQIGDLFQKLRDKLHKANLNAEAVTAQWEIEFWHFVLTEGKLKPTFTGTDGKGDPFEFPDIKSFDDRTYDHLELRLEKSTNPVTRARYANILWNSPRKHTKYAAIAVDAYLQLIPMYQASDKASPNEHMGLDVLHTIKNVYFIGKQANYKVAEIRALLKDLVHNFNPASGSSFALRFQLITLMLKDKFPKEDLKDVPNICWDLFNNLARSGNIHGGIDVLELGEKLESRIGSTTRNWRREVALAYETLMAQAEKEDNPASVTFAQRALENYKLAKDDAKVSELEAKFSQLKTSIKLTEFSTEIDLAEHIKRCKSIAERIAAEPPDEIVKILMHDKNLLPKYDELEKLAGENAKVAVLQHFVPAEIIDQNGNVAQHFADEDEKKYFELLQEFTFELRLDKLHLINEIFISGVRAEKLSTRAVLSYLQANSWFGKTIQRPVPNDKTVEYNWLNLLAPSIHEFFLQFNYALVKPTLKPNLVLPIDSLTLKLEGLLRDLCRFSGITTFYMTKDSKGRSVSREKDVHALLYEEKVADLFDKDDLLFFKFLLVEKAGLNLRHRIAHSLMVFQEYDLSQMYLLLLALLRLGKYDFVK